MGSNSVRVTKKLSLRHAPKPDYVYCCLSTASKLACRGTANLAHYIYCIQQTAVYQTGRLLSVRQTDVLSEADKLCLLRQTKCILKATV